MTGVSLKKIPYALSYANVKIPFPCGTKLRLLRNVCLIREHSVNAPYAFTTRTDLFEAFKYHFIVTLGRNLTISYCCVMKYNTVGCVHGLQYEYLFNKMNFFLKKQINIAFLTNKRL